MPPAEPHLQPRPETPPHASRRSQTRQARGLGCLHETCSPHCAPPSRHLAATASAQAVCARACKPPSAAFFGPAQTRQEQPEAQLRLPSVPAPRRGSSSPRSVIGKPPLPWQGADCNTLRRPVPTQSYPVNETRARGQSFKRCLVLGPSLGHSTRAFEFDAATTVLQCVKSSSPPPDPTAVRP